MQRQEVRIEIISPALVLLLIFLLFSSIVWAGAQDQAMTIHKRLTGVMPSEAVLGQMVDLLNQKKYEDAAQVAIQNPNFYDIVLKNMFASWTNEGQVPVIPLNDATATMVGMVKDNIPFNQVLTADIIYTGDPVAVGNRRLYSPRPDRADRHFQALEETGLSLTQALVRQPQSTTNGIPETSGVLTTQAWGKAYFSAGTNRRVWKYLMINFWCRDLNQLKDTSLPTFRIRRDVDRRPGGDASVFKNRCIGCHSMQDAAIGAVSFYDYTEDDGLEYDNDEPVEKVNRNSSVYPIGHQTTDDSWMWMGRYSSQFDQFGWRGATEGRGLRSLAQAISESKQFSQCIAQKVFKKVCLDDTSKTARGLIMTLGKEFEESNYDVKKLFTKTSTLCMGE